MTRTVYTVGHSNGTAEHLLELLREYGVEAVVDVRSQPYSRYNPQFNREEIAAFLKSSSVEYVFLGRELGARSDDPSCYREGRAQYSLIAKSALFASGIQRLLAGMERFRVAIMCAEKDPIGCHRTILISRHLHEMGIDVRHILENGSLEDHETLLVRLLALHGMQENNLFHSKDELTAMAYEMQAKQIEYSASEAAQPAYSAETQ
jgi:uncharacterized protein (DUF488 family)